MAQGRDDDGPRVLYGWNPLTDPIRRQSRQELQQLAARIPMKGVRFRRRLDALVLRVAAQPMSAAFWALTALALLAGVITGWLGWPIWGERESSYSAVVLAAGSATAFGSVVFSVVSTSFTRAADIAPGYTVVLLGQRSPWLGGLTIMVVAGLLFVHATLDPTRSGAIAASLIAVSAVTLSWVSARQALGSSDPLVIAQNASRYYRRATKRSARFARIGLARGWPKEIRSNPQAVDQLTRHHQRDVVAGLLRQLRAGIRSTAGQGRLTESVMLMEGLVYAFLDYAGSVDGEIGEHDGLLEIVMSAMDSVVGSSVQNADNEAGNYALKHFVVLGRQAFRDPDYAAARAIVLQKLNSWVNEAWGNDVSTVPAASVVSIGELTRAWAEIHAFEDVAAGLAALSGIGARATAAQRKHIGYAATDQLAASFPALANQPHSGLRGHSLKAWSEASASLMRLAPLEPIDGMSGVVDALLPGITLAKGASLQQKIWEVAPEYVSEGVDAILGALESSLSSLENDVADDQMFERGLIEAFSLLYGTTLLLSRNSDPDSAQQQSGRILKLIMKTIASDRGSKTLATADVAELVWSVLLGCHHFGLEDAFLSDAAESLLTYTGADEGWEPSPPDEEYMLGFILGLKVLAGVPEAEINTWEQETRKQQASGDRFAMSFWDWGMRIEGFGRAPSANRNRPAAPPAVIDAVNDSALSRWPRLATAGA